MHYPQISEFSQEAIDDIIVQMLIEVAKELQQKKDKKTSHKLHKL